jgi:transposase
MNRFRAYCPEQAYLLPPSVKDVLPEGHLCFVVQQVISRLDLSKLEKEYSREGGELYAPAMMLSVWLYAYATGMTSGRRLERKMVEDLPLRYLAGGEHPDHWALSAFRRRHRQGINDVFTQVLELVRDAQLGRLGMVAVDSTPIKADNGRGRVDSQRRLRRERAKYRRQIRRWQQQCEQAEKEEAAAYAREQLQRFQEKLAQCAPRLQQLKKSGEKRLPRTDPEARVLRKHGKSVIGYTAEVVASEDHFIVAQRVSQQKTDNAGLVPMVEKVKRQCGESPGKVLADAGYFSTENLQQLSRQGIEVYVPDSNLAKELYTGKRARGVGRNRVRSPEIKAMRKKLRSEEGRAIYDRRKGMVEPVFGTLKAQRDLARFRLRGLVKVGIEFTLACLGYNLTRWQQAQQQARGGGAEPIG